MTAPSFELLGPSERLRRLVATALPATPPAAGPVLRVVCVETPERAMLEALRSTSGAAAVVVVSEALPSAHVGRMLYRHADAFVLADEELPARLHAALEAVAAGFQAMPRPLRDLLDRPALTVREKQALAMVVLDLTNGEIAGRLHLTEASVKNLLTAAFAKLGVSSRSAAAQLIVDPDAGLGPGILRITPEDAER